MDISPLWISLKTALTATLLAFILGIAAARYVEGCRGRLKNMLDGFFILPLVLPPTVVGFLLLVLLGRHGFLGQLLAALGITVIFSWGAAVIASTVVAFPLMYRTALGAIEQVDRSLLDAARTMGLSEKSIFIRVTLPLAWRGIAAGTILAFARALGEFGATLMVAGNIPSKTQTIPLAIFFLVESGQRDLAAVWVAVIVVIALASITALHYWTNQRATQAAGERGGKT